MAPPAFPSLFDFGLIDAIDAKVGADVPLAEAPPGKTLAEMTDDQLRAVLMAVDGGLKQFQVLLITRALSRDQHNALGRQIGHLLTARNALRRYLAGKAEPPPSA